MDPYNTIHDSEQLYDNYVNTPSLSLGYVLIISNLPNQLSALYGCNIGENPNRYQEKMKN